MKKFILILIGLFLLMGCATVSPPSPEIMQAADYGEYPINYQEIIKNYMYKVAIDPTSLIYRDWQGPFKDWAWDPRAKKYIFGYGVCVMINGKNRFGGYVGWKPHYFFIRDGKVLLINDEWVAYNLCHKKNVPILFKTVW